MKKVFKIDKDYIDSRLDRWFKKKVCEVPQSLIEKSIRKGNIKVNNKKEKSSYKFKIGDEIKIMNFNFVANTHKKITKKYIATKKDLSNTSNIFIENNENFVIINKPPGIPVQSGTKSIKNLLDILKKTKEFDGLSPYTVHRIDKETTGVLIVAKNRKYAQLFTSLFRVRRIQKTYLGITIGVPNKPKGVFRDEIISYDGDKKIKSLAVTNYTLLDTNNRFSLIKLNPVTGRKHQLRKQLLMHGCPILGDSKYSYSKNYTSKSSNLMLHAYKIGFAINNIKYNYSAEPPEYFKKILREKYLKIF